MTLLKGKNAIITGCLSGIGYETMSLFAKNGANVWACCQHENSEWLEQAREIANKNKVSITPVYFDFCDPDQIKSGFKTIMASKASVDVLVNIAGMTFDSLFHMVTMDQMRKVFEVNFFATILLTQLVTKLMLRQKNGSVISISSIAAIDGNIGQLSYSASKAALLGATKTLSAELAPSGIRINAIAPGVIKTEMTNKLPPNIIERLISSSHIKQLGMPEDVGNLIVFLASDMSKYITGQVIRIDGGIG
jgi:3-oxoacyl-[acyl-carrier protein] reductase